jgi:hypothetical protein
MQTSTAAKYKPGDRVRVNAENPPDYCLTPTYALGKVGRVVELPGAFPNPESLAYGSSGLPMEPLYRVELGQPQVWDKYGGSPRHKLQLDIWQLSLESA